MTATMNGRISVSAISTFKLPLADDLDFWMRHGIGVAGVSVAKLEAHGWDDGVARVRRAVDTGALRVSNLIGLGPFALAHPDRWDAQRERLVRTLDAAVALAAGCMIFTTGPATPLPWDEAADALESAMAPVLAEAATRGVPFAIEHTNSLRVDVGFVHTLADAIDLARRLGAGVCMEINACWAERDLDATIRTGVDAIRLVQVSDYKVGTLCTPARTVPGDGDIPLESILATVLDAGYEGDFDLELIGPAIEEEGYESAVPRAVAALDGLLSAAQQQRLA
jgi:sugar phosphate isomerase/epimerase